MFEAPLNGSAGAVELASLVLKPAQSHTASVARMKPGIFGHGVVAYQAMWIYGDGSKPCTPVVHIKIAGIYGCSSRFIP